MFHVKFDICTYHEFEKIAHLVSVLVSFAYAKMVLVPIATAYAPSNGTTLLLKYSLNKKVNFNKLYYISLTSTSQI